MHPIGKIIIGVLLVIASLYYIFLGTQGLPVALPPALPHVLVLLNGAIPLFVLLIGIFVVWLEWDEWKIEQELAREERRAKRRARKRKR